MSCRPTTTAGWLPSCAPCRTKFWAAITSGWPTYWPVSHQDRYCRDWWNVLANYRRMRASSAQNGLRGLTASCAPTPIRGRAAFTQVLYAFVHDWPGKRTVEMAFLAPGNHRIGRIESVELLGHPGKIQWEHHPDGLRVQFPPRKPCEAAYCLKIRLPRK